MCTSTRRRSRVRSISIRLTAAASSWDIEVVADLPVLDHRVLVVPVVEPARLPIGRDTEAKAVGVDLLTHQSFVSSSPAPGRGRRDLRARLVVSFSSTAEASVSSSSASASASASASSSWPSSASSPRRRVVGLLVRRRPRQPPRGRAPARRPHRSRRLAGVTRSHDLEKLLVDRFAGRRRFSGSGGTPLASRAGDTACRRSAASAATRARRRVSSASGIAKR